MHANEISALFWSALEAIDDERARTAIRKFVVEPFLVMREWDYAEPSEPLLGELRFTWAMEASSAPWQDTSDPKH